MGPTAIGSVVYKAELNTFLCRRMPVFYWQSLPILLGACSCIVIPVASQATALYDPSLFTSEPVLVAELDGASPPQNPLLSHFNPLIKFKNNLNILSSFVSRLFPRHFATNILSTFHVSPMRSMSHPSSINDAEEKFCCSPLSFFRSLSLLPTRSKQSSTRCLLEQDQTVLQQKI